MDIGSLLRHISRGRTGDRERSRGPKRRTKNDFVHDPPRVFREQVKELCHTDLGVDIRKRCGDIESRTRRRQVGRGGVASLLQGREAGIPAAESAAAEEIRDTQLANAYIPNAYIGAVSTGRRGHGGRVYNVQFSNSGRYCTAAWQDETIRVLDSQDWSVVARAQAQDVSWTVTSAEMSPDETCVAYSTINETVHLLRLSQLQGGAADQHADGGGGRAASSSGTFVSASDASPSAARISSFNMDEDDNGDIGIDDEAEAPTLSTSRSGGGRPGAASARSPGGRATLQRAAGSTDQAGGRDSDASRDIGVDMHEPLDFTREAPTASGIGNGAAGRSGVRHPRYRGGFGVFGLKWSAGGHELVAGCNDGYLRIMDVDKQMVTDTVRAHSDDINSVCFAGSGEAADIVVSGSDESHTPVKVWDRRAIGMGQASSSAAASSSLSSGYADGSSGSSRSAPVGVLPGHLSGVTCVSARGDGRYILSASKDQTLKLWDLRKSMSATSSSGSRFATPAWQTFDYRWGEFPGYLRRVAHENDCSVATYTGPAILQTLIRAYFSPIHTTGGRFIYCGSADDSIYIIDVLTGDIVQQLQHHGGVVRDVAWHPTQHTIASASFDGTLGIWGYKSSARQLQERAMITWKRKGKAIRAENRKARALKREALRGKAAERAAAARADHRAGDRSLQASCADASEAGASGAAAASSSSGTAGGIGMTTRSGLKVGSGAATKRHADDGDDGNDDWEDRLHRGDDAHEDATATDTDYESSVMSDAADDDAAASSLQEAASSSASGSAAAAAASTAAGQSDGDGLVVPTWLARMLGINVATDGDDDDEEEADAEYEEDEEDDEDGDDDDDEEAGSDDEEDDDDENEHLDEGDDEDEAKQRARAR